MNTTTELQLRLMTYNIGGGRKNFGSKPEDIIEVIRSEKPDILVVQEIVEIINADGEKIAYTEEIKQECGFADAYFGPTLSLSEHMHVGKLQFREAIFRDALDWRQGNALFSRRGFVRLGDSTKAGTPRNIPLYRPSLYEGNRDTDPRCAILARVSYPPVFPLVIGTHLTTLLGERGGEGRQIPGRTEEASIIRFRQAKRLLDLINGHTANEIIFLMGDFNAVAGELAISFVLEKEGRFTRLIPCNPQPTHPKATEPIEHIFVYPGERMLSYTCKIVDSEIAKRASDHLPLLAEIRIK